MQSKWTLRVGQRPGGRDVSMAGGLEMMVSSSQEKKTRSKDGLGLGIAGQGDNKLGLAHGEGGGSVRTVWALKRSLN